MFKLGGAFGEYQTQSSLDREVTCFIFLPSDRYTFSPLLPQGSPLKTVFAVGNQLISLPEHWK